MKDYLSIVLIGHIENANYLKEYFIREQKKAEKEFISETEFYNRCGDIITSFKGELRKKLNDRKKELYFFIDLLIRENKEHEIKGVRHELNTISTNNYTVDLQSFTNNKFIGKLWKLNIDFIEENLRNARQFNASEQEIKNVLEILKEKTSTIDKLDYLKNNPLKFSSQPPITSLQIPKSIYNHFFTNAEKDIQFNYWFLKYNAQIYFETILYNDDFKKKLNSELKRNYVDTELTQLNKEEDKAKSLLAENKIDPYAEFPNPEYINEIELLRILDSKFYKENVLYNVHTIGNKAVKMYAKHKIFKPFLINKIKPITNVSDSNKIDYLDTTNINEEEIYTKESILKLKNNLIPSQEMLEIPFNFFVFLTTEKNRNGLPYLQEKDLLIFLKNGFHDINSTNKITLNTATREQVRITYFFHQFMQWSQQKDYEDSSQNVDKYLKLLTKNFKGFDFNKIKPNFNNKPAKPIKNLLSY